MMNENIKINVSLGQLLWREKSKKIPLPSLSMRIFSSYMFNKKKHAYKWKSKDNIPWLDICKLRNTF